AGVALDQGTELAMKRARMLDRGQAGLQAEIETGELLEPAPKEAEEIGARGRLQIGRKLDRVRPIGAAETLAGLARKTVEIIHEIDHVVGGEARHRRRLALRPDAAQHLIDVLGLDPG